MTIALGWIAPGEKRMNKRLPHRASIGFVAHDSLRFLVLSMTGCIRDEGTTTMLHGCSVDVAGCAGWCDRLPAALCCGLHAVASQRHKRTHSRVNGGPPPDSAAVPSIHGNLWSCCRRWRLGHSYAAGPHEQLRVPAARGRPSLETGGQVSACRFAKSAASSLLTAVSVAGRIGVPPTLLRRAFSSVCSAARCRSACAALNPTFTTKIAVPHA